jgi:tight adherence protein B
VLGALLRSGLAPGAALRAWHGQATGSLRPQLVRVVRRLDLGDTAAGALEGLRGAFGEDFAGLCAVYTLGGRLGANVGAMVDGLAASVERRRVFEEAGRAAAAGARLSGRVVAVLPLLLLPATPLAGAPLVDGAGVVLLLAGASLAVTGVLWIERLVPTPPREDDGVALTADLVASAMRGGASLAAALEVAAAHAPVDLIPVLARSRRLVRLGMTWLDALCRVHDERLTSLSNALRGAYVHGLPLADVLEAFSDRRREDTALAFEAALKKAPVLMVVPLTLCVLPSFILLGVAPFLRGLSIAE